MTNLIAQAVKPLEQASIDAAVANAQAMINRIFAHLENNDWDLNKAYPYPTGFMRRDLYAQAKDLRELADSVTTRVDAISVWRGSCKVRPSEEGVKYELEQAALEAQASYNAYVTKLTMKVGCGVVAANMGYVRGIWSDSNLTVEKNDGTKEVWNTKCIVNRSKLGKWFNQFPTRKLKR